MQARWPVRSAQPPLDKVIRDNKSTRKNPKFLTANDAEAATIRQKIEQAMAAPDARLTDMQPEMTSNLVYAKGVDHSMRLALGSGFSRYIRTETRLQPLERGMKRHRVEHEVLEPEDCREPPFKRRNVMENESGERFFENVKLTCEDGEEYFSLNFITSWIRGPSGGHYNFSLLALGG